MRLFLILCFFSFISPAMADKNYFCHELEGMESFRILLLDVEDQDDNDKYEVRELRLNNPANLPDASILSKLIDNPKEYGASIPYFGGVSDDNFYAEKDGLSMKIKLDVLGFDPTVLEIDLKSMQTEVSTKWSGIAQGRGNSIHTLDCIEF